ncbi:restriction endonuclease subunit S [Segatella copri]|uniref:restriction endonuclease subunit S n=1 Tax=Segatella copri TaxID=165179 RepID=UPI001F3B0A34|nr:restriction endonuclease subunit S [Segatella copri]
MEWKEVTLGEISSKIGDGLHGTPKYDDEGPYYFINGNNLNCGKIIIKDDTKRVGKDEFVKNQKELNEQTILVSINGTIGNVAKYNNEPCILGKSACYINVIKEVDKEFIYYVLTSANFKRNITNEATGTTIKNVSLKQMREYKFNIPCNIADQRRIASILSSLDRKIGLNNKINADLEEMAQAIFKNWLSECSDDVTIGELSLNITNYEKTDAEEVVLINSSDVTEGYFDHHNYSPNKNLKGHFKKRFQKGDILYSQVRPRNRHWAYCNFDANDYLASTQLMVIRNNPSLITSILLYQYIISDNVWKEFTLKTETRSGTFPQGNYEDLFQIRVPYNSDVEGISNQLETLYAKMFMLEKENSRLSLLRDTLLPRLMSGELEVPE